MHQRRLRRRQSGIHTRHCGLLLQLLGQYYESVLCSGGAGRVRLYHGHDKAGWDGVADCDDLYRYEVTGSKFYGRGV